MISIRIAAAAASLALLLAGCNEAQDTSQEATADSVELPADEAMADAPMPADDASVVENAADQARSSAAAIEEVEEDAEQAAEQAQEAVADIEALQTETADTQ